MNAYLKFWNLSYPLFTEQELISDLYVPAPILKALEHLLLVCDQHSVVGLITGKAGTGRSTCLKWLSHKLPVSRYDVLTINLIQRESDIGWLLTRMCDHLGIGLDADKQSNFSILRSILNRLDEFIEVGRKLIVMVDAAHQISSSEAFDEISGMLNAQTLSGPCLNFIFAGDDRLTHRMGEGSSLIPRIAFDLKLSQWSIDETRNYLLHRLKGAQSKIEFEQGVIELIYAASGGIPAAINIKAESCLIAAYQIGSKVISEEIANIALSGSQRLISLGREESLPKFIPNEGALEVHSPKGLQEDTPSKAPKSEGIALTSLFKTS